jgi:hypothetical protein
MRIFFSPCRCRSIAAKVLSERNGDSQHVIHAMSHCHIDSGAVIVLTIIFMNSCMIAMLAITCIYLCQEHINLHAVGNEYLDNRHDTFSYYVIRYHVYFQPGYGRTLSRLESVLVAGRLYFDSWTTIQHSLLCAHRYETASTIHSLIQFGIYCTCVD